MFQASQPLVYRYLSLNGYSASGVSILKGHLIKKTYKQHFTTYGSTVFRKINKTEFIKPRDKLYRLQTPHTLCCQCHFTQIPVKYTLLWLVTRNRPLHQIVTDFFRTEFITQIGILFTLNYHLKSNYNTAFFLYFRQPINYK